MQHFLFHSTDYVRSVQVVYIVKVSTFSNRSKKTTATASLTMASPKSMTKAGLDRSVSARATVTPTGSRALAAQERDRQGSSGRGKGSRKEEEESLEGERWSSRGESRPYAAYREKLGKLN